MQGAFAVERSVKVPKDDMHLIIYKILRYLYDCNKHGKIPTFSDMFRVLELAEIPMSYLAQIISEMRNCGFITGCSVIITKDGTQFDLSEKAGVTMSGVEYLNENSRMKKAADIAGRAFEIVLETVIVAAMSKQ